MKNKRMSVAFFLNIGFAFLELFGGLFTGSIAIISDAFHDFCDALTIGVSYYLEKKSKKTPDSSHSYGYSRYSVLGAVITNCILVIGSVAVVYNGVSRLFHTSQVYTDGMIYFAIFGIIANTVAVYCTKGGDSLNQKAVNLHMSEDVLCWVAILIGGIIIKFTGLYVIDALLSFGVGLYVLVSAAISFGDIIDIFLEKTPKNISLSHIKNTLSEMPQIIDVHHIHVRSIDGVTNSATMHVVISSADIPALKLQIKTALRKLGIYHSTLEFETAEEMEAESGEL